MGGNQIILGMENMITKLAKAKDNWFFKILSAAVAVSFISLFGVTGYITTASQNRSVVKVGKKEITQSEFSYRLQKETNALKNLAGDDFELTEEMQTSLTEDVLKQIINDSVLDLTMQKYDIHFPKAFVQQIIFRQPEFINPLNNQFHPDLFKRYLAAAGISEEEYVATVQRTLARKMLISDMIETFAVPSVLVSAIHKMDNQRKSFKYAVITPDNMKIERQISDEEISQYFEDFGDNFMVPEVREAKVLFVPNELIINKYVANDDLAQDYFKQHQKELNQPEKRDLQQMVFMDKETAEKAFAALQEGTEFDKVAADYKAENANEPSLGVVAQDELAEDLADTAFELADGEAKVLPVADTWQVIRVKEIIPAKEAVFEEVKDKIIEELANENMYDALRDARAEIDDAVNGGKSLDEVAEMFGLKTFSVNNIKEETLVSDVPAQAKDLTNSLDFNELVFSYGLDEITSAEEFDNGIATVQITNIIDAHMPEIEDVREDIISLWTVQEKDALAKETADSIVADADDGSELTTVVKARNLEAFRSAPISRNETIADLNKSEIQELFALDDGAVKMFEHSGNKYIIVTPFETVNYDEPLTDEKLKTIQDNATVSLFKDMSQAALDNYAKDFKIKVDYKQLGFAE